MRQHPARATMYAQIEETLTSITLQLRAAIQADADVAARASERTGARSLSACRSRYRHDDLRRPVEVSGKLR